MTRAGPSTTSPKAALDAREKTARKAAHVTEDGRKITGIVERRTETDLFQLYGRDASHGGIAWQCFPATVDPRGSKGK
ncbi:MAG: hypothetical protein ACREK9_04440 [Candidatus Rokuibacteriota bacterium]